MNFFYTKNENASSLEKFSFLLLDKMERNFENNTGKNDITKFRDLGLYIENAKFLFFSNQFHSQICEKPSAKTVGWWNPSINLFNNYPMV